LQQLNKISDAFPVSSQSFRGSQVRPTIHAKGSVTGHWIEVARYVRTKKTHFHKVEHPNGLGVRILGETCGFLFAIKGSVKVVRHSLPIVAI
jgi:hypothetical protein